MARHAATVCFESPLGMVEIEAAAGGVTLVRLRGRGRPREVGDGSALEMARRARAEIEAYLGGEAVAFTVPVAAEGTEFQQAVWSELRTIPFGRTRSYGEVAARLGMRRGARAVGAACRANLVPILVPCHRVVANDGSLGGFRGGVSLKQQLLDLERRRPAGPAGADSITSRA